jgi:hypothetical protein
VADNIKTYRLRRARRCPVNVTYVEPNTIGPLERIVFKDEVVAVIGRDQPSLGIWVTVSGIPKLNALHPDVRLVRLRRREYRLLVRDLDHVLRRIIVICQPNMQSQSVRLDPHFTNIGRKLLVQRRPADVAEEA